jgi:hypothetical protein
MLSGCPERRLQQSLSCCISGAVLGIGGGALAVSGIAPEDVPLAVFGGALFGGGVAAMVLYS